MERLFEAGYITQPRGHHESVYLTEAGLALAKQLAAKHFADAPSPPEQAVNKADTR
jgi:hypothetical protein